MKKLLYRVQRRAVSSVLALSMAFGFCYEAFPKTKQVSADGASTESVADDGVINYVSLGDSMTNGYCLDGYDNNGYMMSGDLSYPELFANWLVEEGYAETVNHSPMAISAMRAEDLQFILELDYNNADDIEFITQDVLDETVAEKWLNGAGKEWRERFGATGDAYTWVDFTDKRFSTVQDPFTEGLTEQEKVAKTAKEFQTAIADADIVSMSVGTANFAIFMFRRLLNAVEFMGGQRAYDAWIPYEVANMELDPQVEKVVELSIDMLKEEVGSQLTPEYQELLDYATILARYTVASYMTSIKASVERIVEMNPDVEIMFVGLMNGVTDVEMKLDDGSYVNFGDYMQYLLEAMNNYVAALPTVLKLQDKDTYGQAKYYYAEDTAIDMLVYAYDDLRDCNWGIYEGLNGSIVRNRMVSQHNNTLYPLMSNVLNPMVKDYGLTLSKVNDKKIAAYEQFAKDWAAYIADPENVAEPVNPFNEGGELLSYAVYLALEDATIAGADASLSASGFMKLINGLDQVFAEVSTALDPNAIVDMDAITAMVSKDVMADPVAVTKISAYIKENYANDIKADFITWAMTDEGQAAITAWASSPEVQAQIAEYMVAEGCDMQTAAATLYSQTAAGEAKIGEIGFTYVTKSDVVNYIMNDAGKQYVTKYADRFVAAGILNVLPNALKSNDTIMGLFNLYARCMAGDGMGSHPSAKGHKTLFDKITTAYAEGYTPEDKLVDTAETAAKYLVELAKQYGPAIAEKAYDYAVENGYVAYVENVIDDVKAEYVALKAELKALRQELVAYANSLVPTPKARTAAPKASTLVEEINATIQCIDEQIAAIDAMIAQLPAMAEEFVKEIATALYNQATYQVEVCLNKLNAKLNALMVKVENAVAAVEAKCIETKNAILAKVAEVEAAAQAQYLAVVAKIEATVAEVKAIVAEIENQINLAYQAAYEVYMGGYVVKHERAEGEEISYLAIGDAAVNGYVNKVAEAWNASAASINNAGTVADLIAALNDAANIEAIENADVISLGFTNNAMVNFVVNQIKASIGWYGATYVELDWASLVTEAGVVYVEKALDTLSAELVKADLGDIALSNVNVSIADILSIAIESYVYKYLEFNLGYYEAANTIADINPDASILMVGMYNPFKGLVVNNIAIGDYVEYMVDIMDLQYTAYAWVMPNVAFVDISDVAPNATYETFEYDFIDILINESSDKLLPTADSYDYIADQIVKAVEFVEVEVPDHEHSYTVKYDENNHWLECECGDIKDVEEHDFDADGKCDCGYETEVEPEVPDHEHSYTVNYDENSHWLECECGDKKDVEAHDFDADGKCDCGYETEVEPENPPVNPEDPEEPKEEPKEEDTISAGAVVGITLASTAVVGASGFSVVWFAVMKKSGADLAIAVKGAAKTAGSAVKNGCGKAIKAIKKLFRK